jgi:hypothetical protein
VPASPYTHAAWIALGNRVRERDGHRCRNCGSPENLQVHHMLPAEAECTPVLLATLGYNGDPLGGVRALLVPLSGLLTVCGRCHEALTNCRRAERLDQKGTPTPVVVEATSRRFVAHETGPDHQPEAVDREQRAFAIRSTVAVDTPPVEKARRSFVPPREQVDFFQIRQGRPEDDDRQGQDRGRGAAADARHRRP